MDAPDTGFTVHGTLGGRGCSLTWEAGQLRGDLGALAVFEAELDLAGDTAVGPPGGPYASGGPESILASALACYVLLVENVFDETLRVEGQVPGRPDPPAGAIY